MSNSEKQPKFKAGDKVIVVSETQAIGVEKGKVYTIKNPSRHLGSYNGKLHNYVILEGVTVGTPNEDCLELYIEKPKPNYREMQPTDLIKISIDGNESEVPIGDLVHAQHLLGITTGNFGGRLWESIWKALGKNASPLHGKVIDFSDDQKLVLANFFKPHYDKQNEKAKLAELIENKSKELDELKEKLSNI